MIGSTIFSTSLCDQNKVNEVNIYVIQRGGLNIYINFSIEKRNKLQNKED